MTIGLSTYAFFWRYSERMDEPLTLDRMLEATASEGVNLFQICDYPAIERMTDAALRDAARWASDLGIRIELGTRGVDPAHLRRYLEVAGILDARLVRTMTDDAATAVEPLTDVLPAYERQGVTLALETYEQVRSADLAELVGRIDSPSLGICLDPANCVAALETPADVISNVADRVVNVHVKDFAFTRREGLIGFTLAGARLGEGLLDYEAISTAVRPERRAISQVVEHWLPWQGDAATTAAMEADWTAHSVRYLKLPVNSETNATNRE